MLHEAGTMFDWNGEWCDYVIVADQDEADIAIADGWVIGKPSEATPDAPRRGRAAKNKDAE